ncbi:Alcohol dehydrogenase, class V [Scheffersomyces stipitis CBS 6054]|uniref:Alcohol dehydrogenase, class V n=1 Tax=Scheffersomyces stipitis (strain ATCC 58785 / CBS 6054 / NBRC 10063 / NRRL Y-11545) TaxID=322104 RepID=A3GHR6_PICST|nr:Alcohol dehydrogenase, class V [Scheffersomyces stipitis CBS 6054]EAZ63099.1 Alcohol dehydrogenase, class V [Scheffersomyces stipitis CBS 6054]KAG2735406.1 hypothetical protein G9P44_001620 [Scheffersomyces stipitis]
MSTSKTVPEKFSGFGVDKTENWNKARFVQYDPKPLLPYDITIKVVACGVCGSDCHTVSGNWGPLNRTDLVVGHEIVGEVIEVGPEVTKHKLGDIVAIGAQSDSCGECDRCKNNNEQYCQKGNVGTYNTPNKKCGGYVTQGGYASHFRVNSHFAARVPANLDVHYAAPLLCGGLTVYSPIVRHAGYDLKEKVIGIVGIGGLGSMAIQIAKALGAKEVVAFSRTSSKKEDAIQLGASKYIATKEDPNWAESNLDTFDMILNCASFGKGVNYNSFLRSLKLGGKYVTVSAPPVDEPITIAPFNLLMGGAIIAGSGIGSMKEADELLKLYADNNLAPWIEKVPISEEGVHKVMDKISVSDVRYRFVLTDFDKAFDSKL